jgi:prepilin-type N-terminal cleavage/methylation domain-containing protein
MTTRVGPQTGFTLIEVLVGLALLSLLSIGILATTRVAQDVTTRTLRLERTLQDQLVAHRFLRRAIGSAYPMQVNPDHGQAIGLRGDDQELQLLAFPGSGSGDRGLQRLRIRWEEAPGGEGGQVVVYARPDTAADDAQWTSAAREVLIEGVERLEWSYKSVDHSSDWSGDWSGTALPRLVRLRLTYVNPRSRAWPELVVATRLTNDANCEFDIVAQGCREQAHHWLP